MGDKFAERPASEVILAATADGVLAVDEHNVVRYCNRAAEELLGQPDGLLTGSRLGSELVPGRAGEIEVRLPDGGYRRFDLKVGATELNGAKLRVASIRDVTQRTQSERALAAALERQGAALALADQLPGPLAEIGALAGVLADDQIRLEPADRLTMAARIVADTARLQFLVSRLLTIAQIVPGATGQPPIAAVRPGAEGAAPTRPSVAEAASGQEPGLTIRERQVLELMGQGLDPAAIAERLVVSVHTARGHVKNVMMKLGAHTQLEAVVTAIRLGLLAASDGPSSLAE